MTRSRLFLIMLSLAGLILSACAKINAAPPPTPTAESIPAAATLVVPTLGKSPLSAYSIPPYYDPGYLDIINASKNETELVIYAEFNSADWETVLKIFNSHYPWIKVKLITPATGTLFEQYNLDEQLATPTADIIISTDTIDWYEFLLRGEVLGYLSQENLYLPVWATKNSGLYPISLDPAVIAYYKNLVSTPPINMLALSNIIRRSPENYRAKIATLNAESSHEALLVNWYWLKAKGEDGWELLGKIDQAQPLLADTKAELVNRIINKSVRIGYFVPASAILPEKSKYSNLEFSYIKDGQPVYMNYMGVTRLASHPNSAKLLLDFLLSQDGQIALSQDNLMPYRSDVADVLDYHLETLENALGTENIILMDIEPALVKPVNIKNFLERWRKTYTR